MMEKQSKVKTYHISEIFYSLQGEGVRAGTPNVFVRFAHCNLLCSVANEGWDCDTEFDSYQKMTGAEIVEVSQIAAQTEAGRSVIFTGGEPMIQLDDELMKLFHDDGWYMAIETNGTMPMREKDFDWICVSPKTASHTILVKRASEVKYVRRRGQELPEQPPLTAHHWIVSPAFGPEGLAREDLEWCIDLVKRNPRWRLSVQQRKQWGCR